MQLTYTFYKYNGSIVYKYKSYHRLSVEKTPNK
jgi:hypothetical protein